MSSIGRAITRDEWAALRKQTMQGLPVWMEEIAAGRGMSIETLPDVLLTYQQELLASTAIHRVVVVQKSRRTGYTWAVASDAVLTSAAAKSAGGMDSMYIGYNLDMAREFVDVCAMWATALNQAASEVEETVFTEIDEHGNSRDIQAFRVRFASGFEIMALSSRPRSLRGKQGYVIIDEAAFHDDLPGLLKAAFALLIWGGRVLIISTHDGDTNPFNELIKDILAGRKPYHLITLDFDQALRDGLYQRICMVTGQAWSPEAEAKWREEIIAIYGDGADEELFVIPAQGSGTFLAGPLIERQQRPDIPVLRFACDENFLLLKEQLRRAEALAFCEEQLLPILKRLDPALDSFFGFDFAMTGDLSDLWPVQLQQNMQRRPPFVLELRNVPYAQQKEIIWYVLDRLPRLRAGAMDATGNGAPIAQETATRYGLERIAQVKLNAGWYKEQMEPFRGAFEDGLTLLPQDLDVYNDHRAIKIVQGVAQVIRKDEAGGKGEDAGAAKGKKKKRHGDSAIAHLLAWVASRSDVVPFVAHTVDQARPSQAARDFGLGGRGRSGMRGFGL